MDPATPAPKVTDSITDPHKRQLFAECFALDSAYRALLKAQFNGKFPSWSATQSLAHLKKHSPRLYKRRYVDDDWM